MLTPGIFGENYDTSISITMIFGVSSATGASFLNISLLLRNKRCVLTQIYFFFLYITVLSMSFRFHHRFYRFFFFFNPFFKIQFGVFEAVKINIIHFSSQDSHGSMGLRGDGIQKIPFQLQNVSGIVKISSGADHFVMLTSRGTVLTAGCPEQGQVNKKLSCVSGVVLIRSGAD